VYFERGEYAVVLLQTVAYFDQHEAAESFFYQMRLDQANLASRAAS
jgi:hypothetical protein